MHRSSLAALLAVLAVLGFVGAARAQTVDAEQTFASRIGAERTERGLGSLTPAVDLQTVARRHAQRMADRGEPYHNPDLGSEVQGWDIVAENVGVGNDVDAIHTAFMGSPTHRDNILNGQVTELGVGVVASSDGRIWVVEIFRRPMAPSPAKTAPTPAPAPRPSAPPPPVTAAPEPAPAPPAATPPATVLPATVTPPAPAAGRPPVELAFGEVPRQAALGSAAPMAALVTLPVEVPRPVPTAAAVAAFLLAASVGFQGVTLRRLGLVG